MNRFGFLGILSFFLFFCFGGIADAGFYQWVDKNGVKHFGENPQAGQPYYTSDGKRIDPANPERAVSIDSGPESGSTESPPEAATDTTISRTLKAIQESADKPRNFFQVEICGSYLKGIYKDIRLCDLKTLADKVDKAPYLLQEEDEMGWTPLTLAIASGCKDTVAYLIDNNADVNQRHKQYGFSPLHLAALTGQKEVVELLLSSGAYINTVNHPSTRLFWYDRMIGTPLHTAMYNSRYGMVKFLLKKGADYNIRDQEGYSLFELAVKYNERDRITRIFEEAGLQVPTVAATVEELMSAINDSDTDKSTLDHKKGVSKVQELLKDHSEFLYETDKYGDTALHQACFHHQENLIRQMVSMGMDVNALNNRGRTPLHYIDHSKEIVRFLIEKGARVNARDKNGRTPLHQIAGYVDTSTSLETAAALIEYGASRSIKDNYGQTPYDIAIAKGNVKLAEIMR